MPVGDRDQLVWKEDFRIPSEAHLRLLCSLSKVRVALPAEAKESPLEVPGGCSFMCIPNRGVMRDTPFHTHVTSVQS